MGVFVKVLINSVIVLFLSSCVSSDMNPTNYYTLNIKNKKMGNGTASRGVVKVLVPVAKNSLNSNSIVYIEEDQQNDYTQSKLSDPLIKYLNQYLIDVFENSKEFKGVLLASSSAKPDYVLESNVIKFEHNLDHNRVDIKIKLILIDAKTKEIKGMTHLSADKNVENANAKSAVKAFNASLDELQDQITEWIKSTDL